MTFYSLKHALNPEKIDAAVDTALAAETLVGTLGTTVGTLETTVGTLETTVGTLETTVDALDKLTVDDDGPVLNEILTQLLALYDPDTHELVLDNGTVKVAAKSP
jgi:hypothetical protein